MDTSSETTHIIQPISTATGVSDASDVGDVSDVSDAVDESRRTVLTTFGFIGQFVAGVSTKMEAKQHIRDPMLIKIALYERLIDKTGPINFEPIVRHVEAFRTWIEQNFDACVTTDVLLLNDAYPNVVYSDTVFLPLREIFIFHHNAGDTAFVTMMWKHILNIALHLTKNVDIKTRLLEMCKRRGKDGEGDDDSSSFLDEALGTLEEEIKKMQTTDEKQIFKQMASNGSLDRLMDQMKTGFEEGNLDLPGIMKFVTKKMKASGGGGGDFDIASLMKLAGGLGGGGGGGGGKIGKGRRK